MTKITRDHSPVGEREDAQQLSELEAMRHPRRNEVYRDVGSEEHDPSDLDFIDVYETPFEPDAALLLCSDGLTDAIESTTIRETVAELAGQPDRVVDTLIDAANAAGGKDNITVVYVEGERFAEARRSAVPAKPRRPARVGLISALTAAVVLVAAFAALRLRPDWRASLMRLLPGVLAERSILVAPRNRLLERCSGAGPAPRAYVG